MNNTVCELKDIFAFVATILENKKGKIILKYLENP
jgi:hypothetical protein